MVDKFSKETRSRIMSRIKGKDTNQRFLFEATCFQED